jgi:hypothetical protein
MPGMRRREFVVLLGGASRLTVSPSSFSDMSTRDLRRLIAAFFFAKLREGFSLWHQALRGLAGRPQTKLENLPWRIVYVTLLIARQKLKGIVGRGIDPSGIAPQS